MARNVMEAWIPEAYTSDVIQRVNQVSVVEAHARPVPMGSDTRHVPRSGGVSVAGVAKGASYPEDQNVNDEVLLFAQKMGTVVRIADEDLGDALPDIIKTKKLDWATSYGMFFDNATIAVTAGSNGTTRLFDAVYYQLSQNNAATGYTANANLTKTGSGGVTYANLSLTFGKLENGLYWDPNQTLVACHGAFKSKFRGILGTDGHPIFEEGAQDGIDRLFGAPIFWSQGLRTSAISSDSPVGNPLLLVGNRHFLIKGVRSGPESIFADADRGAAFMTDEALLKMRARRGFNIGTERAFAILECNDGS